MTDYGARMYDAQLGRWHAVDPLAERYNSIGSFVFVANNPIRNIDLDGKEIWISYGNNQQVRYDNGNLYNEDGTKYEGKDAFISSVAGNLNTMNGTSVGKSVLGLLAKSKNHFDLANKTVRDKNNNPISALTFSPYEKGGGRIDAGYLMSSEGKGDSQESKRLESVAHELFHGLQYENGDFKYGEVTVNSEVGAYLFGRAISLNAGQAIDGFGTTTPSGNAYQNAMTGLLFGETFDPSLYATAIENFKLGSVANNGSNPGIYNAFKVLLNEASPTIKKVYPLIK
jgi:hypothetical protein